MPIGCTHVQDRPPAPHKANCCILSRVDPFAPGDQIVDPATITAFTYRFGSWFTGLIYTCNGGFIDFGHLFENLELTTWYHGFLNRGKNVAGSTIEAFGRIRGGTVTIKKNVPMDDRNTVAAIAASMAFDQSVFYEIETYWINVPSQHNSAFSPEDVVSNYIGVRIAERALRTSGQIFDDAANQELKTVIGLLQPRSTSQTIEAFKAIDTTWVTNVNSRPALLSNEYLKRRNFEFATISPCFVSAPGTGCAGTPTFPAEIPTSFPAAITDYYEAEFQVGDSDAKKQLGDSVRRSNFGSAIAKIIADASKANNDQPGFRCPP